MSAPILVAYATKRESTHEGGDARDWDAIRSWADEIADRFVSRAAA